MFDISRITNRIWLNQKPFGEFFYADFYDDKIFGNLTFFEYFFLSEFYEYFRKYLRPRKVQTAQILDKGVIFHEK